MLLQYFHILWYYSMSQKNDTDNQNVFLKCICWQIGRLLPRILKVSSKQHWVCTHITFRNVVQLHLWIFWSCVCVFQSCICNGKEAQ